jgi:glycosyltransferase involved in cell wall biosynthesis
LAHDAPKRLPANAVYLNIAQYGLEYPFLLRWLAERSDVKAVFFAHDLLPLDHPQYFRPGYRDIFQRRFDAIERRAAAVLATSRVVAERIRVEYERKKKPAPPILAAHLPSPLADAGQTTRRGSELPPYFVAIATLEPRKNHALLLEVWRRLNAGVETPPKLVCVGSPGWSRALVADIRAQAAALSSTVALISDLPAPALRTLLANARALVMPSFAEGYGIPVVEALTLGVPVICSDIPVFREVSQGAGTFLPPADPGAWAAAIGELLNPAGHETARRRAAAFRAQDWPGYFATVEAFLATL